jgi:two-component system chemotaxis response regulator CheY
MNTKRILIVDDDKETSELMRFHLDCPSHEISQAENGAEGLKILKQEPVDLLILNWKMPVMGGGEVLAAMVKDTRLKCIPVLVSSAISTESETAKDALELYRGEMVIEWLQRPFQPNEFRTRIALLLSNKQSNWGNMPYFKIAGLFVALLALAVFITKGIDAPGSPAIAFICLVAGWYVLMKYFKNESLWS